MSRILGRSGRATARVWTPIILYVLVLTMLQYLLPGPPPVASIDGSQRVAAIPSDWPGLRGTVDVHFDPHLVPSIHATHDEDVPYAIGILHAHHRLTQMELMRRVSQGRLAEMGGPLVRRIDAGIRAFDLDRAVPAMREALPPQTEAWLQRYVDGVNDYRATLRRTPADFRALGFSLDEAWTINDLLALGRLLSIDINWGRWLALLPLQAEPGYEIYVRRLQRFAAQGTPSFGPQEPTVLSPLFSTGRTGSNAFVVAGRRSAGAGALLASDPHLGLPQPNLWFVVAYRSPSYAVAGMTFPGLPFVVVGRNEHIGWTGTNMQSASSMLYQAPAESINGERTERLKTRWWRSQDVRIRESDHGPIVTDVPVLQRLGPGDIALKWRGHEPSDEATTFLKVSTASTWAEFRAAFSTYAVGGQNFVYADREGNIGQLLALAFNPAAGRAAFRGAVDPADPQFAWGASIPSTELPAAFDPPDGYLVSANNVPVRTMPTLVPQGNTNDRVDRIVAQLDSKDRTTLDDLWALQRDVYSGASHRLAQALAAALESAELDGSARVLRDAVASWDGHYAIDSNGAVAYQRWLDALIDPAYERTFGPRLRRVLRNAPYVHDFIREDVEGGQIEIATIRAALIEAARDSDPDVMWGDMHRLRVAHPLGNIPLLGRRYVFDDRPTGGSATTVHKAAHGVTAERHNATFGACARFVSDLGTLDENYFVLLGGQDGWMGSAHLLDQIPLWDSGERIPLPLSAEAQRERARWSVQWQPASTRTAEATP
jgi:penicillin amidase